MTNQNYISNKKSNLNYMRKSKHMNIPEEIYDAIDKGLVKNGWYRSVPEFILECTRNKLYELNQQRIERKKLNLHFKEQKQRGEQADPLGTKP
jgi:hypothetical protein